MTELDNTQRIAKLPLETRAKLFKQLKAQKEQRNASQARIGRQSRDSLTFPLSFAQRRLWFLDQLEPGNPFYNMSIALHLAGKLDVAALERSLNEIVQRHEAWRTTFAAVEGRPVQIIAPALTLVLRLVELMGSSREAQAQLLAREESQPFDLSCGPLIRAVLLRLGVEEHVLLLIMHHIVSDGWSLGVFLRELAALYGAYSNGKPSPLPELPIQYADFAVWQRQWLQGEELNRQLAYWQQQLEDAPVVLELPADRPRPALQSFSGAHQSFTLSKVLSEGLEALSQREGVTLFMALLAAFMTLLFRYTRQEDILVGTPIASRTRVELEDLIGFFVNTLVLRGDLSGNPTFEEFLGRVREVTLGAYAHQDLPFEKLVEELHPERHLSHAPLFQAMFVLQNAPVEKLALPGLTLSSLLVESGTSKFDLTLNMWGKTEGLAGAIEYSSDLFDASTINRMIAHFQVLLEGIVADPRQRLADLPLLTEAERRQILVEWNDTRVKYAEEMCLHQLFEAQVARVPEEVAAICGSQQLTYRELHGRATRLAHYLQILGVGPETRVGVCVERSLDLVVSLLGIAKAGGAYVPLDPAYPRERLAFLLDDAQVLVLLTHERLLSRLPAHSARVLCLDTGWEAIARQRVENPACCVQPDNLVYVIYTSGSTGTPKGVLLDHRGRVNNFCDFNRRFAVGPQDRLLALSSPSFDMAAYDVFGTLGAGGTIILPEASAERDPARWAELMVRHRVTMWHSVPALLQLFVEYISSWPELFPHSLRLVLLGGDWIPVALPDQLKAIVEGVQVISLGGATEASMDSTLYSVGVVDPTWKSIPYGRPMANQRCYVLDTHLQPVPTGVPGELHLGGVGLARGYLNCPDLTAQKFIPNPFAEAPGDRLYKTGDLARYRPDGNLELLGRMDHQVKIHGLRIELGEIEAQLSKCTGLHQALVVAREDEPGHKRLVAYIVPDPGHVPDINELRNSLKERLPQYMVPSAFVVLDSLPLTPNGKVDRRNLPAPGKARVPLAEAFVAPGTPEEKMLAKFWSEILGIERIGIHDNFFSLGGDSILSIRIIARANEAGIQLTPKQLFQHQTIAELAAVASRAPTVQEDRGQGTDAVLPASAQYLRFPLAGLDQQKLDRLLAADSRIEDIYPLSPMQQNMLFHSLHAPQPGLYVNQTTLSLPGDLHVSAWEQAWQLLVDRYAVLRTSFVWEGIDEPLQVVHQQVKIALEQYDWRGLAAAEQKERLQAFCQAERARGFDLSQAPLMRLAVIRLDEDAYRFIKTYHYLLLDGWSRALLWKEVFAFYEALCIGQDLDMEPGRPYRNYIAWIKGQDLFRAETFWRSALRDFTAPTPLVLDQLSRNLPDTQEGYVEQEGKLSRTMTAALQSLAQQQHLTVNTLVQGAWVLLLSRYSGKHDVVFGVTSSGRPVTLAGVDSMVGLFINTLPVRVQVSTGVSLMPWLKDLQAQQAELRQYEYSSLLKVQEWSGMPRGLPLFESVLNFDNYPIDASLSWLTESLDASDRGIHTLAQTEFPLRVDAVPGPELSLEITYYRGCFADRTITQVLEHFRVLLEGIATSPDQRLGELMLLIEPTDPRSKRRQSLNP